MNFPKYRSVNHMEEKEAEWIIICYMLTGRIIFLVNNKVQKLANISTSKVYLFMLENFSSPLDISLWSISLICDEDGEVFRAVVKQLKEEAYWMR